jgi:hypothetical protein
MKQVKVKFQPKLADDLASKLFECDGNTMFSWSVDEIFADSYIIAIVVIPEDKVNDFTTAFGKYIVK